MDIPRIPAWAAGLMRRAKEGRLTETDLLWKYPEKLFHKRGMTPDKWQLECLLSLEDLLFNCSRQVGKSETTAAIVTKTLLCQAPALVLVLSPTDRQSVELLKTKIMPFLEPWLSAKDKGPLADMRALIDDARNLPQEVRITKNNEFSKELSNGSRIVALPGKNEGNIRSYSSVDLLVIDEASRVLDALYHAVTPMLMVAKTNKGTGRKIVLSTPFGKRGFFYDEWSKGKDWKKVKVSAHECPRLSKEDLDKERRRMGERMFKQEYENSFVDAVGQLFPEWAIAQSLREDIDSWDILNEVDAGFASPVRLPPSDRITI